MSAAKTEWKVLPHGPFSAIDDGLYTVVGTVHMPLTELPRRMTVARLKGGGLVVFSAIALDEAGMAALEAAGRPAFLIVPNAHHRLDAAAWKQRYPEMQVVAPVGAREQVAEAVAVDTTEPDLGDPTVRYTTVAGTRGNEACLTVETTNGTTLVLNDVVANIRHASGFGGWMLRLMGFAGDEAQVPAPVKLMLVKDKEALRAQMLEWAGIGSLRRILVAHGDPIEDDPKRVLRELADSLG